mmetsp:Transcript_59078/g.94025  ORF Transcript_59078/g.94025 Transcript_59078/m.94025 type:complete len:341 (+) Transcript_59078:114-1136(+)
MAQQLNALQSMQEQLLALQNQINHAMEEKKQAEELQYKGKNMKVVLIIGNKQEFVTDTDHLFHKDHGNTLFLSTFLAKEKKEDEGSNDDEQHSKSNLAGIRNEACIRLEFPRNPGWFQYIIDYLSGYNLEHALRELSVVQLERLQNDAMYYRLNTWLNVVTQALYARFNPYLGSPFIELKKNATVAVRSSVNTDVWQSTAVYGALYGTSTRYVEINMVSEISKHVMLGVTEAEQFRVASYPGGTAFAGCSYYCANGYMYRSASSEGWGEASGCGDKVGALVKLNRESDMATIAFYKNGVLLKEEINLKNYMDVSKGVVFVVGLYNANEYVQLVQNPVVPQ